MMKEAPESLDRTVKNAERIKKIVQDLRGFSRKDDSDYNEKVTINQVVTDSLAFL